MAAVIATTAWFLLREADRARSGAVLAGSIYRDVLVSIAERDRFIVAPVQDRMAAAGRFFVLTNRARSDLASLAVATRTPEQAEGVARASADLDRYTQRSMPPAWAPTSLPCAVSAIRSSSMRTCRRRREPCPPPAGPSSSGASGC